MKKSLGLIETAGLAAGIEAADAAVKSANVELIGYELTKGGGWTTIKVQGDVGAVKAAVDAARMAAAKVNQVVSTRVIPRPSAGLDILVHNPDTVGDAQSSKGSDMPKPPTPPKGSKKVKEEEAAESDGQENKIEETQPVSDPEVSVTESKPAETLVETEEMEKAPVSEAEASATDSKEAETEDVEVEIEEEEKASMPEGEASVIDSKEAEPEGIEEPTEEAQDAGNSEGEEGEASPEQELKEPATPKQTKRGAAKGRKGGKRSNKNETTE